MAKKRADGEGTLYYHDKRKRWVLQVPIGRTSSERIRRKTFYGRTQDGVLEKRKQYEREQYVNEKAHETEDSEDVEEGGPDNGVTVNQLLDLWLDSRECSWSSLERYQQIANTHIRPRFGKDRVADITPVQIQLFYNEKKTKLSPRTVEYIHVTLNSALKYGTMLRITDSNPAERGGKAKGWECS